MDQDNQPKKKKVVGLAISGGWIRAAAAIGTIEILEENGVVIDMVAGTSAGAIVAGAYAAGNLQKLKKKFMQGKFREYWEVLFEPSLHQGLFKGNKVKDYWRQFVDDKDFAELPKPLFLAATDLNTLSGVIIDSGNVAEAMQACVGVPGMFVPIKYGEKILSDGGNLNLIPSQILYERGADYVIAVDVSKAPNIFTQGMGNIKKLIGHDQAVCLNEPKKCHRTGIFSLIWRSVNLTSSNLKNFNHAVYHYNTLIRPNVVGIRRWHISKVDYLIKRGREAALKSIVPIKHDLDL